MPPLWRRGEQPCNTWAQLPLEQREEEQSHHRHAAVNNITHGVLVAAKIQSCLEPSGLYHTDGKCPDSIHSDFIEEGEAAGLGCNLSQHLSFFLLFKCHQGSRSCGSPNRGEEDIQVHSSQPHAFLHSRGNRDIWSLWVMNHGMPLGVGSAVGSSF